MKDQNIQRQLKRQIAKFLPQELLENNSDLQQFIQAVNLSYLSFDRDAELSELSSRLNDKEYLQINSKIKEELEQKRKIHNELFFAIKQLSDIEIKLESDDSLIDLITILNKEIDSKKEFENQLFWQKRTLKKQTMLNQIFYRL